MTEQNAPSVGDVIGGKYELERVIGRGGMGLVFAARHLQLQQQVAIKFLLPHFAQQRGWVDRFLREAQVAFGLRNEHVVRVLDVSVHDNSAPYIVMEYLTGVGLRELVRQRGPLPLDEAVGYILQVCEALAEAHARGFVHRDLKPSNLFVTWLADGSAFIKVLDFGIVKQTAGSSHPDAGFTTETGEILGSPFYMSPEQLRQHAVDARCDIWALGINLYQMLTGKLPFVADSSSAMMLAIAMDDPQSIHTFRPELPAELHAIFDKCFQKDPARRFTNMAAFANALLPFASLSAQRSIERIASVVAGTGPTPAPLPAAAALSTRVGSTAVTVITPMPEPSLPEAWGRTGQITGRRPALGAIVGAIVGATTVVVIAAFFVSRAPAPPAVNAQPTASATATPAAELPAIASTTSPDPAPAPTASTAVSAQTSASASVTPTAAAKAKVTRSVPKPAQPVDDFSALDDRK